MTEAEWLASGAPEHMLNVCWPTASARQKRLFGCACCRLADHLLSRKDRAAIQVAELFADGEATAEQLDAAYRAGSLFGYVCTREANDVRWVWSSVANRLLAAGGKWHAGLDAVAGGVRDIFGNPFCPVALNPAWLTSDVLLLARGIYDDRAFDRMPILADALQDAGCDHPDVLAHCRDANQVHARGCWVIDLLLGKG